MILPNNVTVPGSDEQKLFYDTFGFLVLPQVYDRNEMQAIDDAFEQLFDIQLKEKDQSRDKLSENLTIDPGFCERHPVLRALTEDRRITETIDNVLGLDGFYASSDGHLYHGDTVWHADVGWGPNIPEGRNDPNLVNTLSPHYTIGLKAAMYLDPIVKETGALRIVPGSHINPLHEELAPLSSVLADYPEVACDPRFAGFGTDPKDMPCHVVDSQPGDVLIFHSLVWHASFGGTLRRMFSMWHQSAGQAPRERKVAKAMKDRAEGIAKQYA